MSRVIYYQYAFNSEKEKLNILAKMLEPSKTGRIYSSTLCIITRAPVGAKNYT